MLPAQHIWLDGAVPHGTPHGPPGVPTVPHGIPQGSMGDHGETMGPTGVPRGGHWGNAARVEGAGRPMR